MSDMQQFQESERLAFITYRKLYLPQDEARVVETTVPTSVLIGENHDKWLLNDGIYIAYNAKATIDNKWWNELRTKTQIAKIPILRGDLCVCKRGAALRWNDKELLREMINFFVIRYRKQTSLQYNFCDT